MSTWKNCCGGVGVPHASSRSRSSRRKSRRTWSWRPLSRSTVVCRPARRARSATSPLFKSACATCGVGLSSNSSCKTYATRSARYGAPLDSHCGGVGGDGGSASTPVSSVWRTRCCSGRLRSASLVLWSRSDRRAASGRWRVSRIRNSKSCATGAAPFRV
jgi:hypothetical protein